MSPITKATTTRGRLIRKTDPHQKCSSIHPPITGPTAANPPPSPDHSAIAVIRGRPRYKAPIMDRVVGKTRAAATPPKNRAAISTSTVGAQAASMEVGTVATAPMTKRSLRPYRSPMVPRYSTVLASPRAKEFATSVSWSCDAPRSSPIVGSATLATARLMFATIAPVTNATRTKALRGGRSATATPAPIVADITASTYRLPDPLAGQLGQIAVRGPEQARRR
jgi:hypothetical protein